MEEEERLDVVQKILDERDRLLLQRLEAQEAIKAANRADLMVAQKILDVRAAGRVFGQAIAIVTDAKDFASLEALREAMTKARNDRPWEPGESRPLTAEQARVIAAAKEAAAALNAAKIDGGAGRGDGEQAIETEGRIRIRDLVIEFLRSSGPKGALAATIRTWLKTQKQIDTHSKTVGMTLYRLSLEGLATRNGRTWFLAEPAVAGETKNPGVSPPGLIETGR